MTRVRVLYDPKSADDSTQPAAKPLTHHEILTFIGPFTRRGRHADMAATQRAERRLVFKPIEQPSPLTGYSSLRENLELKVTDRGSYRLVRTLTAIDRNDAQRRLSASLTATGDDCDTLIEQIERFPPARHFPVYADVVLQQSYRLERQTPQEGELANSWLPVLTQARAELFGVALEVDADRGGGMPANLRLRASAGQRLRAPQDLLAVLGRSFRPLEDYSNEWRGAIRASKKLETRTPGLEKQLELTVMHLADTLSQPPEYFHARHRRARWKVTLRRATPLLVTLGLIAAAPAVSLLSMPEGSFLRLVIFHAPPLMLASLLLFDEVPRIELPPLPRPLRYGRWLTTKS